MPVETIKKRIDQDNNNLIDTNEINNFIFDENEWEKNLDDLWCYLNNLPILNNDEIRITIMNDFFNSDKWKEIENNIIHKLNSNKPLNKQELSLIYIDMISNNFKQWEKFDNQLKFESNKPIDQIYNWKLIQFIKQKYLVFMYTWDNWQEHIRWWINKFTFWDNLTENQKDKITKVLSSWKSPITIEMITDSCKNAIYVPVEYLLAFMQNDSRVWTMWLGAKTHNPWNVWNTGKGKKDRWTWEKWVEACANNLQQRIIAYLDAKSQNNWKGFNDFPTPEEIATWKSKWWFKFFWIYMTASDGPKKVAGMVKTRASRLKNL